MRSQISVLNIETIQYSMWGIDLELIVPTNCTFYRDLATKLLKKSCNSGNGKHTKKEEKML